MAERKKLELSQVELRAARALQRLRKSKRFSVRGLSEAVSNLRDAPTIGPNAISQIENEGRRMTISDSWALARALDVSPLEFYLPVDGADGGEFVYHDGDEHGANILALRVIRHLYRLPDESAPARWREIARQSLKNQIDPLTGRITPPASDSGKTNEQIISELVELVRQLDQAGDGDR